jgi:hypothetical protein
MGLKRFNNNRQKKIPSCKRHKFYWDVCSEGKEKGDGSKKEYDVFDMITQQIKVFE